MKKTSSSPAEEGAQAMPVVERRTAARTHNEPWPEAMREELRKLQFLDAVDVDEVNAEAWQDIFACFEGRHVRFI